MHLKAIHENPLTVRLVEVALSTCFEEPFWPLMRTAYSQVLSEKIRKHRIRCYLINADWPGGYYEASSQIDIPPPMRWSAL